MTKWWWRTSKISQGLRIFWICLALKKLVHNGQGCMTNWVQPAQWICYIIWWDWSRESCGLWKVSEGLFFFLNFGILRKFNYWKKEYFLLIENNDIHDYYLNFSFEIHYNNEYEMRLLNINDLGVFRPPRSHYGFLLTTISAIFLKCFMVLCFWVIVVNIISFIDRYTIINFLKYF